MEGSRKSAALYTKAKNALSKNAASFEHNKLNRLDQAQIELINRVGDVTNTFFTILDPDLGEFLHITPNAQTLLGYPAEGLKTGGLEYFLELLHEEEVDSLITFYSMSMGIFTMASVQERLQFKTSMDLRLRTGSGTYRRFLRTSVPLAVDSSGNILAWLNSYQDIHYLKSHDNVCLYVKEGSILTRLFRYSLATREIERIAPFTRRELEVLQGLSAGLSTRQIAEQLSVTNTVVNNHRRKLLAKTSACTTESMITFLTILGFLHSNSHT